MRLVMLILALWTFNGCRKDQAPVPPKPPLEGSAPVAVAPAREAPSVPAETSPSLERVASNCPDQKVVTSGGDDSPEGVLLEAYRLAAGEDSEEARARFLGLFVQGAPRDHILGNIWPRVREHVTKYVQDPKNPSYTLCRRVPLAADRVKIFVRCQDPRKSDPPSVLILEQGKWRLDVMTP